MLTEIISVLEVARPVAKSVPGVGSILEGMIEAVLELVKTAEVRQLPRNATMI